MRHRDFGLFSTNTLICVGQHRLEYVSRFMGPDRNGDPSNEVFRAYRYAADSLQIRNRAKPVCV
jgi:hypothetical protein